MQNKLRVTSERNPKRLFKAYSGKLEELNSELSEVVPMVRKELYFSYCLGRADRLVLRILKMRCLAKKLLRRQGWCRHESSLNKYLRNKTHEEILARIHLLDNESFHIRSPVAESGDHPPPPIRSELERRTDAQLVSRMANVVTEKQLLTELKQLRKEIRRSQAKKMRRGR